MAKRNVTPAPAPAPAPAPIAPVRTSMMSGRKAYLPLEEGKAYKVQLQGWTERPNENPETQATLQGFVTFKWKLIEDGRIITDNRTFPVGTDILANALMQQLPAMANNGIEQEDLFQNVLDSATPVDMWVERRSKDDDLFTNYHFREFKAKTPATPASTANTSSVEAFN